MKKSQIPQIAKAILKELNKSESKNVCINVYGDKYEVYEDSKISKCEKENLAPWAYTVMQFNYENSPLPTQEHIEQSLYNSFIKTMS